MIGALARAGRLAAARRAELDRRFRDDPRLVRAWCRLCGGEVEQGSGVVLERRSWEMPDLGAVADDRAAAGRGEPQYATWSRQHESCVPDLAWVFSEVIGEQVTPSEAMAISVLVAPPAAYRMSRHEHAVLGHRRGPWAHVGEEARGAIRAALDHVREETVKRSAPDSSPCGVCGTGTAYSWRQSRSVRWAHSGQLAWLCGSCVPFEFRDDLATPAEVVRERVVRHVTNWRELSLPEFGFRLRADLAPGEGSAEAFAYSAAIEAVRAAAWTIKPRFAPEERRAEFQHLHDEHEAEVILERVKGERAARDARMVASSPLGGAVEW